jgi:nucleoside-diphosphate-sugar epimerase
MKILITGGAGFIGFFLAKHLLADPKNELVLTDNLFRGRMDADLTALLADPRVTFIQGDLTDPAFTATLPADCDHVYHLAAVNGTKLFYEIPHEVLRINTLTLTNILAWITTLAKKPKLCFTSSNEAYAGALASFNRLPIPTPENVPLVISDTYNPRWTYAATKLIGELFVIHYAERYRFPAVIVRPHNFYGPRAGYDHVIPEFSKRIQDRVEPFAIYGQDETRTFCYITDAVRAMQMLMDSSATDATPIETVHIGNTDEVTMRELAEKMFAVTGWKPATFDLKDAPAGSVKRRLADISKIKKLVGWEPAVSLEEGLKTTYEWYATHPKGK